MSAPGYFSNPMGYLPIPPAPSTLSAYPNAMEFSGIGTNHNSSNRPIAQILTPIVTMPLNNGAPGFFQQMLHQQQSALTINIPLGENYQVARNFLAEALLNGSFATKQYLDELAAQGVSCGMHVEGDQLQLKVIGPKGQEGLMTQAALKLLCRPQWDGPTLASARKEMIEGFHRESAEPAFSAMNRLDTQLFGANHPFGQPAEKTFAELQNFSIQHLSNLHRQLMQYPERMSFSMVSSLPPQEQAQHLNQAIQAQNWFASPYRQDPPPASMPLPQIHRGNQHNQQPVLVANPNAERAHVVMAWRAPAKNDPDYLTFLLIKKMLGSMSGGFFKVLRTERGLVYGTQQMIESHTGLHSYKVYAQVNFDKLPLAIDGLHDVVNELVQKPVPDGQLAMAKSAFLFELMAASEETLQTADRNDQFIREGVIPPHPQQYQDALARIKPEDIQRVAQRVFAPQVSGGFEGLAVAAPEQILKQYFPGKIIQPSVTV